MCKNIESGEVIQIAPRIQERTKRKIDQIREKLDQRSKWLKQKEEKKEE